MNKKHFLAILSIGFFALIFQSMVPPPPPPEGTIESYQQAPPWVDSFWVQKLEDTLSDGSNMRVLIKYQKDGIMGDTLDIYYGDNEISTFRDDGTVADNIAGDSIYSAYIKEDIPAFLTYMHELDTQFNNKGYYLLFTGHDGEKITSLTSFDFTAFNNFQLVAVDQGHGPMGFPYVDHCYWDIKKENSLFITDINVVEDYDLPSGTNGRSYRVTDGKGKPMGLYTFGNLIKNITNNSTSGATSAFIKDWLRNWTITQSINGQNSYPRENIFPYVIEPWLKKCGKTGMTFANWEQIWDATAEDDILANAPFKLTAIANRIDLRGNAAYTTTVNNAGETRFIFTLINPQPQYQNSGSNFPAGDPPREIDVDFGSFKDRVDWQGMNVILEYGNVQSTACQLRDFAQSWVNLSYLTLGSTAYKNALENIVRTVVDANAAPTRANGSALNRIRTNEKILFPVPVTPPSQTNSNPRLADWESSDWQFRQFELDAGTGFLKQVPLTNTPMNAANYPWNLNIDFNSLNATTVASNLIDWAFSSPKVRLAILQGKHLMPTTYPSSSDYLLAATADMDGEFAHYWDFLWSAVTTHYDYQTLNLFSNNNLPERKLRQQVSLNTCQGCHSGETKGFFTQVRPMSYGMTADYWNTPPDNLHVLLTLPGAPPQYRSMDDRFVSNKGKTDEGGGNTSENYDKSFVSDNQYFVQVSAFLTGRNYTGKSTLTSSPTYDDDNPYDSDDNTMDGLYYVKDPANDALNVNTWSSGSGGTTPGPQNLQWGYNDLERRKKDLCQFINNGCSGSTFPAKSKTVRILSYITHLPFQGND